jgi:hypothetical protein
MREEIERKKSKAGDWDTEKSCLENQIEIQSSIIKEHEKLISSLIHIQKAPSEHEEMDLRHRLNELEVHLSEKTSKLD